MPVLNIIIPIIPNLSTLEPYVENSIICSGFWDNIGDHGGQTSVTSMQVTNRIKEGTFQFEIVVKCFIILKELTLNYCRCVPHLQLKGREVKASQTNHAFLPLDIELFTVEQ